MSAARICLARVSNPPDTSRLQKCDPDQTARAISLATLQAVRKREILASRGAPLWEVEPLLGQLRRLQSAQLASYECGRRIVLSEPFGAVPRSAPVASEPITKSFARSMLGGAPMRALVAALSAFGEPALRRALAGNVRIRVISPRMKYARCSPCIETLVPDIDSWQAPPAGLFVLEERLILLRSKALRMTVAHEFAHALDALLAGKPKSYFSFESRDVRHFYATANSYVNEYAASGLDEYFAESMRAYVEVNDDRSSWPPLTRFDLQRRDPRMFALLDELFRTGFTHQNASVPKSG